METHHKNPVWGFISTLLKSKSLAFCPNSLSKSPLSQWNTTDISRGRRLLLELYQETQTWLGVQVLGK